MNVPFASAFRGAAIILALGARSAAEDGTTYVVDAAPSVVVIHAGRAGVFKFAGGGPPEDLRASDDAVPL